MRWERRERGGVGREQGGAGEACGAQDRMAQRTSKDEPTTQYPESGRAVLARQSLGEPCKLLILYPLSLGKWFVSGLTSALDVCSWESLPSVAWVSKIKAVTGWFQKCISWSELPLIDKIVQKQIWCLLLWLGLCYDSTPLIDLTDLQPLLVLTCCHGYRAVSLFLGVWGVLFKFSKASWDSLVGRGQRTFKKYTDIPNG